MSHALVRRASSWTAALFALAGLCSAQTTWFVDAAGTPPGTGSQGNPYTSVQFALAQPTTVDGDTLTVLAGTYAETVDFLGKAVRVVSASGPAQTTIDAQGAGSVVTFASGETAASVLEGFALTGGTGTPGASLTRGGGVFVNASAPTIRDCDVHGNRADRGGGVHVTGAGAVTLESTTVRDNIGGSGTFSADGRGGAVFLGVGSTLTAAGSTLRNNRAGRGGGIDALASQIELTQTSLADNTASDFLAPGEGGGIYAHHCASTLDGCSITGNLAEGSGAQGGGLRVTGGTTDIANTTIAGNAAGEFSCTGQFAGTGGGLYALGQVTVTASTLDGNFGAIAGGNVYGEGQYTSCTIANGCSQFGAGVNASGPMTLTDCVVEGNSALSGGTEDFGGGAYSNAGALTLVGCTLRDNLAFGDGGGAFGATLDDCELVGNRAIAPGFGLDALGGGAYQCTLTDCILGGNSALGDVAAQTLPGWGGGTYLSTVTGCTFFDNTADVGGGAAQCALDRVTVTRNSATMVGDGVDQCSVSNSIVWGNGDETGSGANVSWSDVQGGALGMGNIDADPLFWCPQIDDFFLMAASPCRDAADPAQTDQDGSRLDMGARAFDPAHEVAPVAYCASKTNSLGCLPFLTSQGTPSPTEAGPFKVIANDVLPDEFGTLLYGGAKANVPFHGGTFCIKSPFARAKTVPSKTLGTAPCVGRLSYNFNQRIRSGIDPALTVGHVVTVQFRQRDPADPTGFADSFTNGLRFVICP